MANNPLFQFEDAKREKCKASIMIQGLSGRGKSGLALLIAYHLSNKRWDKVFDIDTENGSIKLFSDIPSSEGMNFTGFKIGNFTKDLGYSPSNYLAFRESAIDAGAEVVIEDSITHAWMYKGGVLDLLADAKKKDSRYAKDSYAAWGEETVAQEKLKLFDLLRDHRVHVITTVRVKERLEYDADESGKKKLISLGETQIMQADTKFEPDLVLEMVRPGSAIGGKLIPPRARVIKSRYAIFSMDEEYDFTPEILEQLRQYLEEGTSPEELLEKQRLSYIEGMKEYLDAHPNAVAIWQVLKKDAGYEKTALDDIPLDSLKRLFVQLTLD